MEREIIIETVTRGEIESQGTEDFFKSLIDPGLREAIASIRESVPPRINAPESRRLRELMIGGNQQARETLVLWCVPTLEKALNPLWGGRFGLGDNELFLRGFEHVCQLVGCWSGRNQLTQAVGKHNLQRELEVYICQKNGLRGAKNMGFIGLFWNCVRNYYYRHGRVIPSVDVVEQAMRFSNQERDLGFNFSLDGWRERVSKIYDSFFREECFTECDDPVCDDGGVGAVLQRMTEQILYS